MLEAPNTSPANRWSAATFEEIKSFIREFEACSLPKSRWTHEAHLLVGLWYLSHHQAGDALSIVRRRIRAYNDAVGTANTDTSGYHETLTCFFLRGIKDQLVRDNSKSLPDSLSLLLDSPLVNKDWPLTFYSRERLFSITARHQWLAPDFAPYV